jgi:hypothetical protein
LSVESGAAGKASDITTYVRGLPLYDVHEHHMPESLHDREVGLLKLLEQSYAGWTQARPYRLAPDEPPFSLPPERPCTWEDVARYVEGSGSNAFVTSLVSALTELYGLGDAGITQNTWEELDHEIRRRHESPEWVEDVIARAGIVRIITDPFTNILLDAPTSLGPRYRSVARINCLAVGWHPDSHDHNGNSAHAIATALDAQIDSFDDFLSFLELFVDTVPGRSQVALKNALAYDRDLRFDEPDEGLARRAFGKRRPSAAEQKAFGDFVVDRLCALAGERGLPVQMHLGTALVRGSHPMHVAGLVERHPGTRFLLMHLGYPWSRDLLGLAFVYRNIWLDLTWSFLLSPSHFKLALHEAIEILPDESRLMLGGDAWHVEESYGALALGRRLIAEVLHERMEARFLSEAGAQRLADRILHENGRAFFEQNGD